MSIVLCGIRYLFGKNYYVKNMSENLWKIAREKIISADRNLQRAIFVNTFFDKNGIVSNFHFSDDFHLEVFTTFVVFPNIYLPNFHIPNIPIFHGSKFLQFWTNVHSFISIKSIWFPHLLFIYYPFYY